MKLKYLTLDIVPVVAHCGARALKITVYMADVAVVTHSVVFTDDDFESVFDKALRELRSDVLRRVKEAK